MDKTKAEDLKVVEKPNISPEVENFREWVNCTAGMIKPFKIIIIWLIVALLISNFCWAVHSIYVTNQAYKEVVESISIEQEQISSQTFEQSKGSGING